MTTLLENPVPILFAGIAAEAILAVVLVQTGRGVVLLVMVAVLLLVLGGVGLEALVVTDREQVENTLDAAAAALVDGDLDRVLSFIAPEARASRREARWALGMADFQKLKITNLEINVVRTTSPPTARAKLVAMVTARDRDGDFGTQSRPVGLEVQLRQQGDRWVVIGHEREPALGRP